MAKDIRECLLAQARKFHQWQEITYPGKTTEEIGGAWEVDYPAWNDIFDAFCHVLTQMNACLLYTSKRQPVNTARPAPC